MKLEKKRGIEGTLYFVFPIYCITTHSVPKNSKLSFLSIIVVHKGKAYS